MRRWAAALSACALVATAAAAEPVAPAEWRAAAAADLAALHDIIIADTPVGAHVAGAHAEAWLNEGYAQAQAALPGAETRESYEALLALYADGFRDPHLRIEGRARGPSPLAGQPAAWGFSEPAPGIAWIGAPSFSESEGRLAALIGEVDARGDAMRQGRAIVVDLRGNGGGATTYARQLADAVFGARIINRLAPANPGGGALWRVSRANADYWRDERARLVARFGPRSAEGRWARSVEQGLTRALARGEDTWRQGGRNSRASGGLSQRRPQAGAPPFPARVYVLSNGACMSACLDFADLALAVPGVRLIGGPTGADGLMAEVRAVWLPSGGARAVIPQKLMLGRGRGAMEAYTPDIAYPGPWTDAAVRAWALTLIAAQ